MFQDMRCVENGENMSNTTYETTDLYLGCFLKARGLRLVDARREGRRATFVFEDRPERSELIREFYNDGTVRVNDFKNALQDLKAIVYNV
jgi:hypothetical protein